MLQGRLSYRMNCYSLATQQFVTWKVYKKNENAITAIIQQNKKIPEIYNKITWRKGKERYPKNEVK